MANETNLDNFDHFELNLRNMTTTSEASFFDRGSKSTVYFEGCVVAVGLIGALVNGLVLRVLCTKDMRKQTNNVLLINQVSIDLYCCCCLVVAYGTHINTDGMLLISGWWSSFLCKFFINQVFLWMGLCSSTASLVAITLERYVKILHPIGHRKHFRQWMVKVVMILTWIVGFLENAAGLGTSEVVKGNCFPYWFWPSGTSQLVYGIMIIVIQYVIPLSLFIFCYARIIFAIRKRNAISSHEEATTAAQSSVPPTAAASSSLADPKQGITRSQLNVIKTMMLVCLVFAITWFPNQLYYFFILIQSNLFGSLSIYYTTVFIVFLNVCINPFIYAAKHDAVKQRLVGMLHLDRFRRVQQSASTVQQSASTVQHPLSSITTRI